MNWHYWRFAKLSSPYHYANNFYLRICFEIKSDHKCFAAYPCGCVSFHRTRIQESTMEVIHACLPSWNGILTSFFIITRVTRIHRMLKWSMTSVPHDSSYLNSTQRHISTLIQTIKDVTVHAIARLCYIFSSYLEMFFVLMLIPDPKKLCNVPTFFRLVPVRFLKNIFFS